MASCMTISVVQFKKRRKMPALLVINVGPLVDEANGVIHFLDDYPAVGGANDQLSTEVRQVEPM